MQPLAKRVEVLQGQHRRRHQHGHLPLIQHGFEGGAQGDLGLAVADIAADQPIHRAGALHVLFDLVDGAHLIGRLLIGEGLFEFPQPRLLVVRREGMANRRLADAVEPQQIGGDIARRSRGCAASRVPTRRRRAC